VVFSEADELSLQRALLVAPQSTVLVAPETPLDPEFPLVGSCSAQAHLASALYVRGYARDVLPKRYETLSRQLAASPCRVSRLRTAWAGTGEGELPVTGAALREASMAPARFDGDGRGAFCGVPDFVMRIPMVKPTLGTMMVQLGWGIVAYPDWFKLYKVDGGVPDQSRTRVSRNPSRCPSTFGAMGAAS